jgi:hypothetical protein
MASLYKRGDRYWIGYYRDGDLQQVRGLRLLKDNPNFELEFYDESVTVAINSRDADYIKQRIRDKIRRCSVTVCLIGKTTHTSRWVEWELETSEKLGKKTIVMALKGIDRATLPAFVKERNLPFHAWDPAHLARLISEA